MPLQALIRQGRRAPWLAPFLAALLLLLFAAGARAAEGPYLELDTKGHMALIRSIVFTPDGSELISASDDKTIRV
jgi:WD40 repeat protein